MASNRVEHELPFIRFLRWDGKALAKEPIGAKTSADHTFVVSASPVPLAPPTAVCVEISTGTTVAIDMIALGAGHLWQGSIARATLARNSAFVLRVAFSTSDTAACEIELKTK